MPKVEYTALESRILGCLLENGPNTSPALAAALGVTPEEASHCLQGLAKREVVRGELRRNCYVWSLTESFLRRVVWERDGEIARLRDVVAACIDADPEQETVDEIIGATIEVVETEAGRAIVRHCISQGQRGTRSDAENARLCALLHLYRKARAVDGRDGRPYDASALHYADLLLKNAGESALAPPDYGQPVESVAGLLMDWIEEGKPTK